MSLCCRLRFNIILLSKVASEAAKQCRVLQADSYLAQRHGGARPSLGSCTTWNYVELVDSEDASMIFLREMLRCTIQNFFVRLGRLYLSYHRRPLSLPYNGFSLAVLNMEEEAQRHGGDSHKVLFTHRDLLF